MCQLWFYFLYFFVRREGLISIILMFFFKKKNYTWGLLSYIFFFLDVTLSSGIIPVFFWEGKREYQRHKNIFNFNFFFFFFIFPPFEINLSWSALIILHLFLSLSLSSLRLSKMLRNIESRIRFFSFFERVRHFLPPSPLQTNFKRLLYLTRRD